MIHIIIHYSYEQYSVVSEGTEASDLICPGLTREEEETITF